MPLLILLYPWKKGHKINKTDTYLERRISYILQETIQCHQWNFATYSPSELQLTVIFLLEESIVYRKGMIPQQIWWEKS